MHYRQVFYQLALLLLVLSCLLFLTAAFSGIHLALGQHSEKFAAESLAAAAVIGGLLGGLLWLGTRRATGSLGRREALLLVSLSWIIGAALAAMPYRMWAEISPRATADHPFASFVNCYFETMSGLTTTGATILSNIEYLPDSLLLWRALTHWFGGLGIVVLFVAVLPSLGVGGKKLFRVEAPGPSPDGLSPQIRETARALWYIYLGLTVVQTLALWAAGMGLYEAACHSFATLATGGFSTRNASVGAYNSTAIDIIIIVFMFLAGANFGLFYHVLKGRVSKLWQDTEFRFYAALVLGGSAIVSLSLINQPITMTTGEQLEPSVGNAIRQGFFTTVSIQTTTGFCTSDFNLWPNIAKTVLILLMFVGGCAGSTSGGIKVIRVWIALKVIVAEIERVFRPKVMRPVKIGKAALEDDQKIGTLVFVLGIVLIFAIGSVSVLLLEEGHSDCDYTTASTASVATLCTIGPGLARVGAVENYGWFCDGSKWVFSVLMVIGRLEIFAIVVLFTPRFWRGD
ncbi:MAG: TrkH family potassium uptake protein [Planctomycetota bacterium]|nr:TrkH family potassium uptake protein [Planctomycetota bacterium]